MAIARTNHLEKIKEFYKVLSKLIPLLCTCVYSSIIHNTEKVAATQVSINY
jgi:hypothetical protein